MERQFKLGGLPGGSQQGEMTFCLGLNRTLYMAGVYICILSQLSLVDVQVG